jgi:hypothetical protein
VKRQGAPKRQTAPVPGRGRSKRQKILLAVCEGQTERSYLDRLNDRYAAELSFSVQLAPQYSRGQSYNGYKPHAAVATAVSLRASAKTVKAELWAVFDRDENTPQEVYAAFRLARQNGIRIAFSHPCFELWLLLHFKNGVPGPQSGQRKPVQAELRRVPNWQEFGKIIEARHFKELTGRERHAAESATALVRSCPSGRCGPTEHAVDCDVMLRDPSTSVDGILRSLGIVPLQAGAGPDGPASDSLLPPYSN